MWKELVHSKNEKRHVHANDLKVGAPGNLAKTLYESKKLLKFIETVNILLTQINIQEKG